MIEPWQPSLNKPLSKGRIRNLRRTGQGGWPVPGAWDSNALHLILRGRRPDSGSESVEEAICCSSNGIFTTFGPPTLTSACLFPAGPSQSHPLHSGSRVLPSGLATRRVCLFLHACFSRAVPTFLKGVRLSPSADGRRSAGIG